jgi:hypothetical protein
MRIYKSPSQGTKWLFSPYRESFNGARIEERVVDTARQQDYRFVHAIRSGDTVRASFCGEKGVYDFASRFRKFAAESHAGNAVYLERKDDDHCLFVVVKNGEVHLDRIGNQKEIAAAFRNFCNTVQPDSLVRFTLLNFQYLENGVLATATEVFGERIVHIPTPLTDKFLPEVEFEFVSVNDLPTLLKSKKRPTLLYGAFAAFSVFALLSFFGPEEKKQEVVQDPYESYFTALKSGSVYVRNRLAQDYNNHIALMTLPGWTLEKVTQTMGQASYSVKPDEKGSIELLKLFAQKHNMVVMVSQMETVVISQGANQPVVDTAGESIYEVEDVHHFIRDAVDEYIPNSRIELLRDVPQGVGKWKVRELMFVFDGIYKEDLLTLGSITHGYPVSFGGDSSDPAAGGYNVVDQRFTGAIKISVYGE